MSIDVFILVLANTEKQPFHLHIVSSFLKLTTAIDIGVNRYSVSFSMIFQLESDSLIM